MSAAIVIFLIIVWCIIFFRERCDCGRQAGWWFQPDHEKSWLMFLAAAMQLPFIVMNIIDVDRFWIAFGIILGGLSLVRWWKHESGKIKKKAAKALGRIVVNQHGRLAISTQRIVHE